MGATKHSIQSVRSKHAYLVLAHQNIEQVAVLLRLLNHPYNEIYLHWDLKSRSIPVDELARYCPQSGFEMIPRRCVSWGALSGIKAEFDLLEAALRQNTHYAYLHLLSGSCLPIKSQAFIHDWFDSRHGVECVGIEGNGIAASRHVDRVRYHHFLQEAISHRRGLGYGAMRRVQRSLVRLQQRLDMDRCRNEQVDYYKGSNWFSITEGCAEYVVAQRHVIERRYRFTRCGDELFMQTLLMNSPFAQNVLWEDTRLVDWRRGSPYVFRTGDYEQIVSSDKLFCRKFDITVDAEIINAIAAYVTKGAAT